MMIPLVLIPSVVMMHWFSKNQKRIETNFDIAKLFGEVTNGQSLKFRQALLYYITTTNYV